MTQAKLTFRPSKHRADFAEFTFDVHGCSPARQARARDEFFEPLMERIGTLVHAFRGTVEVDILASSRNQAATFLVPETILALALASYSPEELRFVKKGRVEVKGSYASKSHEHAAEIVALATVLAIEEARPAEDGSDAGRQDSDDENSEHEGDDEHWEDEEDPDDDDRDDDDPDTEDDDEDPKDDEPAQQPRHTKRRAAPSLAEFREAIAATCRAVGKLEGAALRVGRK